MRNKFVVRASTGVADQAISSGTNFATAFIAARMLSAEQFGYSAIALALIAFLISTQRAVVGESLLILQVKERAERLTLQSQALSCSFAIGCFVFGLAFVVLFLPSPSSLVIFSFIVWSPVMLLQDSSRYVCFAENNHSTALLIDTIWALSQAVVTVLLLLLLGPTVTAISVGWGAGALISVVVFFVRSAHPLKRPTPQWWFRRSYRISTWLTLVALLGQGQNQAILFLIVVGFGYPSAGGYRAVQLLTVQPVQTLLVAVMVLLVPFLSRAIAEKGRDRARRFATILSALLALAASSSLLLTPFSGQIVGFVFPLQVGYNTLLLPLLLLTLLTIAAAPIDSWLRAEKRTRALAGAQCIGTIVTLGGVVWASTGIGIHAVAWAVAAGYAAYLCSLYLVTYSLPGQRVQVTRAMQEKNISLRFSDKQGEE